MNSMDIRIGSHLLLLIGWMGLSTYWYTCRFKNLCLTDAFATHGHLFAGHTVPHGLAVAGTPVLLEENIRFFHSRDEPVIPPAVKRAFNLIQSHLATHEELVIEVTGAYTSQEENNSLLGNLGQSRAEAVRAWLADQGISRTQITTQQVEADTLTFSQDTLLNGLAFRVIERDAYETFSRDTLQAVTERLQQRIQSFYFHPETSRLVINPQVKRFVSDLRAYLEGYPQKSVTLTGFTRESADSDTNFRLARADAAGVRQALVQAGLNRQQIHITSKGAAISVADSSRSGQHRRVEVYFNP